MKAALSLALASFLGLAAQTGCKSPRHARQCSMRVDVERLQALCSALEMHEPIRPGSAEASLVQAIGAHGWRTESDNAGSFMCGHFLLSWFDPAFDEPCPGRPRPDCYRIKVHEFEEPRAPELRAWRVSRMWNVEPEGWQDDQGICKPPLRGDLISDTFFEIDGGVQLFSGLFCAGSDPVHPISLEDYFRTF